MVRTDLQNAYDILLKPLVELRVPTLKRMFYKVLYVIQNFVTTHSQQLWIRDNFIAQQTRESLT